jgi:hypothetical protein
VPIAPRNRSRLKIVALFDRTIMSPVWKPAFWAVEPARDGGDARPWPSVGDGRDRQPLDLAVVRLALGAAGPHLGKEVLDLVRRDRVADARIHPVHVARRDPPVDAHQLAVQRHQRPARVAGLTDASVWMQSKYVCWFRWMARRSRG